MLIPAAPAPTMQISARRSVPPGRSRASTITTTAFRSFHESRQQPDIGRLVVDPGLGHRPRGVGSTAIPIPVRFLRRLPGGGRQAERYSVLGRRGVGSARDVSRRRSAGRGPGIAPTGPSAEPYVIYLVHRGAGSITIHVAEIYDSQGIHAMQVVQNAQRSSAVGCGIRQSQIVVRDVEIRVPIICARIIAAPMVLRLV